MHLNKNQFGKKEHLQNNSKKNSSEEIRRCIVLKYVPEKTNSQFSYTFTFANKSDMKEVKDDLK